MCSSRFTGLGMALLMAFSGFAIGLFAPAVLTSQAEELQAEPPIYPVWKTMSGPAKRQFLAGYLMGFRDAKTLGEIALSYSRQHPEKASSGLERLLEFYHLSALSPAELVPLLDDYFSEMEHRSDSLRLAINNLQRRDE